MRNWDYNLPENWQPKTPADWQWYLIRRINYGDFQGLKKEIIKQYFPTIKNQLDPGKRLMIENYFKYDETD